MTLKVRRVDPDYVSDRGVCMVCGTSTDRWVQVYRLDPFWEKWEHVCKACWPMSDEVLAALLLLVDL